MLLPQMFLLSLGCIDLRQACTVVLLMSLLWFIQTCYWHLLLHSGNKGRGLRTWSCSKFYSCFQWDQGLRQDYILHCPCVFYFTWLLILPSNIFILFDQVIKLWQKGLFTACFSGELILLCIKHSFIEKIKELSEPLCRKSQLLEQGFPLLFKLKKNIWQLISSSITQGLKIFLRNLVLVWILRTWKSTADYINHVLKSEGIIYNNIR